MPYMPCKNPNCNRYRKVEEDYCVECRTNGLLKVVPPKLSQGELNSLKQSAQELIQQSMDNGIVKSLGELEEYNIYED